MRLGTVLTIVIMVFIVPVGLVSAHPGNTASDGGHYCWSNCEYWGEVYGERHFHGGYSESDTYTYTETPEPPDPPEPDYPDEYVPSSSSTSPTSTSDTTAAVSEETANPETEPISDTNDIISSAGIAAVLLILGGGFLAVIYWKEISTWYKKL